VTFATVQVRSLSIRVNGCSLNLFNALFQFHPREGHTPKENFLSEALAHVLATCDAACDACLTLATGRSVCAAQRRIVTRATERDENMTAIFPDMRVTGACKDGLPFDVCAEHKWDSPCDPKQIKRYLKLMHQSGDHRRFAFVCASYRQKRDALNCDPKMAGRVFLWADVFQALESIPNKPDILIQFLDFMKSHGLSPGKPIEPTTMVAFIQSAGFLTTLEHSANKLNDEFDWDFIPKRYRMENTRSVTNRWGRVAIEFATPEWKPTITVGFLFDEWDHGVSFVNRQKGVDLLFRIETAPGEQKNISPALAELARKRKKLSDLAASVLLLHERGNDNSHSLLIARSCLADIIENAKSQQEQLRAVHDTVKRWAEVLFGGSLHRCVWANHGVIPRDLQDLTPPAHISRIHSVRLAVE